MFELVSRVSYQPIIREDQSAHNKRESQAIRENGVSEQMAEINKSDLRGLRTDLSKQRDMQPPGFCPRRSRQCSNTVKLPSRFAVHAMHSSAGMQIDSTCSSWCTTYPLPDRRDDDDEDCDCQNSSEVVGQGLNTAGGECVDSLARKL